MSTLGSRSRGYYPMQPIAIFDSETERRTSHLFLCLGPIPKSNVLDYWPFCWMAYLVAVPGIASAILCVFTCRPPWRSPPSGMHAFLFWKLGYCQLLFVEEIFNLATRVALLAENKLLCSRTSSEMLGDRLIKFAAGTAHLLAHNWQTN